VSKKSNIGHVQIEPLITVKQLKERYLFGIDIKDKDGNEISDLALQTYIDTAVSMLEHYLDIAITPRCEEERKDYYANDYMGWGFFQLNRFPILKVDSVQVVYSRNEQEQDEVVLDIPKNWIRLNKETGIIRLIPNNRFPASLQVDNAGAFFPELFRRHGHVPDLWVINYDYGFDHGKIPVLINSAIGLIAATYALSIAGNLVLGAGIAGQSISLDGLSQSIQTTQSAENSAYSATLKEYASRVFGATKDDPNSILRILKDYYKGQYLNII
jgi:hypothetical protein